MYTTHGTQSPNTANWHLPNCSDSLDLTLPVDSPSLARLPLHSLTTVGLTLAGALIIALSVILGCYCKTNGAHGLFISAKNGYRKHVESVCRILSIASPFFLVR